MADIFEKNESLFDSIRHINEYGQEYWLARELQVVLEYSQWRRFTDAIERAKLACKNSGYNPDDHFADAGKMVTIGSGAEREVEDFSLSRYACYLIVMNSDPRKEVIALGQTYFAIKTRQQELIENYEELNEDQKRIAIRKEMKRHNLALADAAHNAGVIEPTVSVVGFRLVIGILFYCFFKQFDDLFGLAFLEHFKDHRDEKIEFLACHVFVHSVLLSRLAPVL